VSSPPLPPCTPGASSADAGPRVHELDWIKSIGAGVVVLGHSLRSYFESDGSAFERWLGPQLLFSVAGFLAVSGFLYATPQSRDGRTALRRLQRIGVPYLVASLLAQLYRACAGESIALGTVVRDLLTGASFGPFYYVFHIALLTLVTPLLARLSRPQLSALTLAMLGGQVWLVLSEHSFSWFWEIRNPLRWWPFFLVGWWLRPHLDALRDGFGHWRGAVASSALGVVVFAVLQALDVPAAQRYLATWLEIWCVLLLLFLLVSGRPLRSYVLWRLGEMSYGLYLYHLFAIYTLRALWPAAPGLGGLPGVAATYVASLALTFGFLEILRVVLGRRSREWLGA